MMASHAQMPEVAEAEADRDIRAAVRETRQQKRIATYKPKRPTRRKA